jgi:glucose/arabinose dehydrogenase
LLGTALLCLVALVAVARIARALPDGAPASLRHTLGGAPGPQGLSVETVVSGLAVPWALAWATDGRHYLTQRPGRVRVVERRELRPEPVAVLPASQGPPRAA